MTIQSIKGVAARLLTAGLIAGAITLAVPAKADAQAVFFTGRPHFDRSDRFEYDRFRAREFRRQEEWRRYRFEHRLYR